MEAKEVMVGDYVRTIFSQKIVKVKEIRWSCIYIEDNGYEYNEIEPIPLTTEILEKNGFEKSYSSILTADGYKKLPQYKYKNTAQVQDICRNLITISYSDLEGDVYDIQCGMGSHIYDLKYVHQLQHALRLCGIEKEIEL